MKLESADSSLIAEHGYDLESKTLAIRFRNNGKLFHFADVPQEAADAFTGAPSLGKHFHAAIRGKFAHEEQEG